METEDNTAIVPQPHGPGLLYRCPHCLALFALRFMGNETRPLKPVVRIYRCITCQAETRYLASRDERNV